MKWIKYLNPISWLIDGLALFGSLMIGVGVFLIWLREEYYIFLDQKLKQWR